MKINSVWHLTFSGRTLRIDSTSIKPSKKNAVAFTRKIYLSSIITEDVRLASREVANLMKLRKYLVLSPGTSVVSGTFTVKPVEMSRDGAFTNLLINENYYFLSVIPEDLRISCRNPVILIPASPVYYKRDAIDKIKVLLEKTAPASVILSGEYSDIWFNEIIKMCKCSVVNEVLQTSLF
jgi:hypothetical protein